MTNESLAWWRKLDIVIGLTEGERNYMQTDTTEAEKLAAQEQMDAIRLIQTRDPLSVEIGKKRLRFLLGKETPEDFD